ncbi:MAG: hypothetical protein JSR82_19400 [Verrucomicrobia bacterium]|nr:hypothetical protein [Verrucomicrobiota bacterium]
MNNRETARFEAIQRVGQFGLEHAADLKPAVVLPMHERAQRLFQSLNAEKTGLIARLAAASTQQQTAHADFRGGATAKSVLRDAIMSDLRRINEAVASLAEERSQPELMHHFRMPWGEKDEVFATRATAFVEQSEPLRADLVSLGLPEDFHTLLATRVADFKAADQAKATGLQSRVGAGEGLDADLRAGLAAVRQLNVILKNLYRDHPTRLAAWRTAARVHRTASRQAKAPEPQAGDDVGNG